MLLQLAERPGKESYYIAGIGLARGMIYPDRFVQITPEWVVSDGLTVNRG